MEQNIELTLRLEQLRAMVSGWIESLPEHDGIREVRVEYREIEIRAAFYARGIVEPFVIAFSPAPIGGHSGRYRMISGSTQAFGKWIEVLNRAMQEYDDWLRRLRFMKSMT